MTIFTIEAMVNSLFVLLSVGSVIWFLYGPWQKLVVDSVRLKLFSIRDRLFLLAADGRIKYDSAEYKSARSSYNSLIRFAHDLRWTQLLATILSGYNPEPTASDIPRVWEKIENVEIREMLKRDWNYAIKQVVVLIWLRSPLLMAITMIILPVIILEYIISQRVINSILGSVTSAVQRDFQHEVFCNEKIMTPV